MNHQGLWLINQLFHRLCKDNPQQYYVNIRAIHNVTPENSESLLNQNIAYSTFTNFWNDKLCSHLTDLNSNTTKPANIYFGINPRVHPSNNKKVDCAGFTCLYLDLDVGKGYSTEQRLAQLAYWEAFKLPASLVINSGHGFHAYWILRKWCPTEYGEKILKNIIAKAGCKAGGNCADVTRLFRLPGFFNTKYWQTGDSPLCEIIYPKNGEVNTYVDAEYIEKHFPATSLPDLEKIHNKVKAIGDGIPWDQRLRIVAEQDFDEIVEQNLHGNNRTKTVSDPEKPQINSNPEVTTETKEAWQPYKTVIPHIDGDPGVFKGRHYGWMKQYAKKGHHVWLVANPEKALELCGEEGDRSPSAFESRIIYNLVKQGYTYEALLEFWHRSELKLHRPDKEARSPNYLALTYEKMLAQVKADHEEKENPVSKGQKKLSEVFTDGTYTFLRSEKGDPEIILTGVIHLKGIYIDVDAVAGEREYYDAIIYFTDPTTNITKEENTLIPVAAFNSIGEFKKLVCRPFVHVLTNLPANLQKLLHYLELTFPAVPRHTFHSKLSFKKNSYIFPHLIITKDEIKQRQEHEVIEYLATKNETFKWFGTDYFTKEQTSEFLSKNWSNLLNFHMPRVIISVLGVIAARAMKPRLEEQSEILEPWHIPTVNIRGSSHSGKSETVKLLLRLTGMPMAPRIDEHGRRIAPQTISLTTSEFALRRIIDQAGFVPVLVDEFKMDQTNKNTTYQIESIRKLVRQMYSGESEFKGRANLSISGSSLHSSLIVVGEHHLERIGDISEISRVIPISTDEYQTDLHVQDYRAVASQPWHKIAPWFYQHLLNVDINVFYQEFLNLRDQIVEKLRRSYGGERSRIGHNIAFLIMGCKLFDSWVLSLVPNAETIWCKLNPMENLAEYMANWSIENEQTMILNEKPISNNEFFQFLDVFKLIVETKFPDYERMSASTIPFVDIPENADRIFINLGLVHEVYTSYCIARHNNPISLRKLYSTLTAAKAKGEEWVDQCNVQVRVNEKNRIRGCILVLSSLLTMNKIAQELIPTAKPMIRQKNNF